MRFIRLCLVFAVVLMSATAIAALEIRDVRHDRDHFDPGKNEQVTIRFTLSDPASVSLNIYDGRDLLIRSINSKNELSGGEHTQGWDGKDQAARPVPPGAYHYTLVANTQAGETVEYDLTDLTGGDDLDVKDIQWDPDKGGLRYVLTNNARVNIRIGLKNDGPLLRTLINWVPRQGGVQTETWDGKDESGVLDLAKHARLVFAAQAFSLSDNTLLVGPNENQNMLVEKLPWGEVRREVKKRPPKRMYAHAQQPLENRGDFNIELVLPDGIKRNKAGVPIVSGSVPVRLDIDDRDRARALAQRFEPVFFLDGVFVFENETGFLPMTWNWDASAVNPGTHYLTANLRGYEGNFGIATVKVNVEKEGETRAD